jgi:hypothetical protein
MASSSSRSSSLPLLFGGMLIVLVTLGALWMLDQDADSGDPAEHVAVIVDEPVVSLPEPIVDDELPKAMEREQQAEPLITRAPAPVAPAPTESWEDPVIVFGHVQDSEGKRLPEIEVNLNDDEGDYADSVLTDEQGLFQFTSDIAFAAGWSLGTEPDVVAEDDPAALVPAFYVHHAEVVPGDAPVECVLVLSRPPRVEGRVYDAETGQPIQQAEVEIVCASPAWETEFQDDYTDDSGYFSMTLVDVPSHQLMLKAEDDDGRYAIFGPLDLEPGEVRILDIPLSSPLSLSGQVRSREDDSPVDGADVTVLPAHPEFEGIDGWDMTDDSGNWFIEDIGVPADRVWLYVMADGFGPELLQVTDPTQEVDITLGGMVTLTGRITERGTDTPVTDATVRVVLRGPTGVNEDYEDMEFADEDGHFSIELETVPAAGAELIIESDEHVRYRVLLSDVAPVKLRLPTYDISVNLRPLPLF